MASIGIPRTIRGRVAALSVAVLGATLLVFAVVAYAVFSYSLWQRHDEGLRATVDTIAVAFRTGINVEGDEWHAAHHLLNELRFPNRSFSMFDEHGEPFPADSGASLGPGHVHGPAVTIEPAELLALAERFRLFDDPTSHALVTRPAAGGDARLAVVAVTAPATGTRYLIAAEEPNASVESLLALLRNAMLVAIPVLLLVAWVGGQFLARRSLAPVTAMSRQARQIGAENLDVRLPVADTHDEIGELALTFNELLDRVERAFDDLRRVTEQMRRFTADASHELRTPLAAVRGEAQVALSRDRTETEYRESVEVMLEEAVRMGRIVDDMLTLARADAGEIPIERAPVYLDEVVADAARTAKPLAEQRGVALDLEPSPEAIEVVGDEDLLRRAVLNLVDNAIKYTEPGGTVRARAVCDSGGARVEIEDTGPGIAPADRERIFERFYRIDKARSRDAGGAGLGLSIVRWAAEAHGGRVDLASEPGAGSRFSLVLPRPR